MATIQLLELILIIHPVYALFNETEAETEYKILLSNCVMDAVARKFPPNAFVLALLEESNTTSDYVFENSVLKQLNSAMNWTLQVSSGEMTSFKSWRQCLNCNGNGQGTLFKNHFQSSQKPTGYIVMITNATVLSGMLRRLKTTSAFNTRAYTIVFYISTKQQNVKPKDAGNEIMETLYKQSFFKAVAVVRSGKDRLHSYTYDLFAEDAEYCMSSPTLVPMMICKDGKFRGNQFLATLKFTNLKNCTVNALAVIRPPFVINQYEGLEIEILQAISRKMNITFNITITNERYWGNKVNGTWNAALKVINDNPFNLGVGCFSMQPDRLQDFEFSKDYFIEKLIWVVPIALPLPRWKGIFIIFSPLLWVSLLGVFVVCGLLFYVLSNLRPNELNALKPLGASIVFSLQLTIGSIAKTQPRTRIVRILFLYMAMFNLIISTSYQGSLINVMTNPQYEEQISTEEEVYESGLGIGGLAKYKNIFDVENDERALKIYNNYEIYADVNDTMYEWVLTVAQDRDTITLLGQFYIKYLLSQRDYAVKNADQSPRIFITDDLLYSFPVRIVFSKGFPMKNALNEIIDALVRGGLIHRWHDKLLHIRPIDHDDLFDEIEDKMNDEAIVITVAHMEGAFWLLILGQIIAITSFVLELILKITEQCLAKEIRRRRRLKRANIPPKLNFITNRKYY